MQWKKKFEAKSLCQHLDSLSSRARHWEDAGEYFPTCPSSFPGYREAVQLLQLGQSIYSNRWVCPLHTPHISHRTQGSRQLWVLWSSPQNPLHYNRQNFPKSHLYRQTHISSFNRGRIMIPETGADLSHYY